MVAPWPEADLSWQDRQIEDQFARFQEVLRAVREVRSRQNVPPRQQIQFHLRCEAAAAELLQPMRPYFESMAGARLIAAGPGVQAPALSSDVTLPGLEVYVDLAGLIDVEAEMAKKRQELHRLEGMVASKQKKLANDNFVSRAPAEVVEKERESLRDLQNQQAAVAAVLERLGRA